MFAPRAKQHVFFCYIIFIIYTFFFFLVLKWAVLFQNTPHFFPFPFFFRFSFFLSVTIKVKNTAPSVFSLHELPSRRVSHNHCFTLAQLSALIAPLFFFWPCRCSKRSVYWELSALICRFFFRLFHFLFHVLSLCDVFLVLSFLSLCLNLMFGFWRWDLKTAYNVPSWERLTGRVDILHLRSISKESQFQFIFFFFSVLFLPYLYFFAAFFFYCLRYSNVVYSRFDLLITC